jgi:hypothetical protein
MERDNAVKILQILADGVDPATGEPFPASSPYQRADIVRALYAAMQALGNPPRAKASTSQEKPGLENAGRPWTQEEDARLGRAFDAGNTVEVRGAQAQPLRNRSAPGQARPDRRYVDRAALSGEKECGHGTPGDLSALSSSNALIRYIVNER